jgi:hypothetical protein
MDIQDTGAKVKYLIRDRDVRYPASFDAVLAGEGIEVVKTGIRMPRMNANMERWIRSCRAELLHRTLIWNQAHLLHALHEYEQFHNEHRPHTAPSQAPLPYAHFRNRSNPTRSSTSTSANATASAASCTNTIMPPDLHGHGSRHLQGLPVEERVSRWDRW